MSSSDPAPLSTQGSPRRWIAVNAVAVAVVIMIPFLLRAMYPSIGLGARCVFQALLISTILAFVAIVLAIVALVRKQHRGLAVTALVIGGSPTVLLVAAWVIAVIEP